MAEADPTGPVGGESVIASAVFSHEWISAIADLLWPVLACAALVWLGRTLIRALDSGREVRLKVGDYEISVGEVQRQQNKLLRDLTWSVVKLRTELAETSSPTARVPPLKIANKTLLWVDDHPANNAVLIDELQSFGVTVITAASTKQAEKMLARKRYDFIVSDMQRGDAPEAGLDLLELVRADESPHKDTPFYLFCSGWAAQNYCKAATERGADGITGSGMELLAFLAQQAV